MSPLLAALAPEAVLLVTALAVLGLGVSIPRARNAATSLALVGGILSAATLRFCPGGGVFLGGMISLTPLAGILQLVVLGLALVAIVFAADSFPDAHFAEALALILFAALGMMLLCATDDLLMIFLALELTSLPLYVLAAFEKSRQAPAEAALKYFLVGSVSAAFLLYGISLIFGVTGTTNLHALSSFPGPGDPLLLAGMVMVLCGFAFKVAAVPFQLWAPDVYEGAPTAAAALIASGSKVAAVFILAKFLFGGLGPWAGSMGAPGWAPVLAVAAAASMVLGNLAALVQSSVKRLLAYSAIANGGYLLLGLASGEPASLPAVLFYVIIYALTTAGAFGVVILVEKSRGGSRLEDFDGLSKSSPGLAICLLVFLMSLAGIPPLAGFFGKFYLFATALENPGLIWLVALAVALNAISLYYYLIVLKHALVLPAPDGGHFAAPAPTPTPTRALVAALALLVLAAGLFPNLLLTPLTRSLRPATAAESAPACLP